jgi:hypothetical protein
LIRNINRVAVLGESENPCTATLFVLLLKLFSAKGKKLYHKECSWNTDDGSDDIGNNWRISQYIIKDNDDNVFDDKVWNIRNCKFYVLISVARLFENNLAIHVVSKRKTGQVAKDKGEICVGNTKGEKPGEKTRIEGIDTANKEKQNKFTSKKMMLDLFYDVQGKSSFDVYASCIIHVFYLFVNFIRKYSIVYLSCDHYNNKVNF